MKKLMILVLVLGFVSVANAGKIDVMITSLNGVPIAPVKSLGTVPSDIIGLTLYYCEGGNVCDDRLASVGFDIVVAGPATLDMSQAVLNPRFDIGDGIVPPASVDGAAIGIDLGFGDIVVDNIFLHRDGSGDITLNLVNNPNLSSGGTYEYNSDGWFCLGEIEFSGVSVNDAAMCWDCPWQSHGDATGDARVSTFDLIALKKAWGTDASDPHGTGLGEYNCCADFTQDGRINVFDLIQLKKYWGAIYTGPCTHLDCP